MVNNRYRISILFSLILFGFCLNSILLSFNDFQTTNYEYNEIDEFDKPKIAAALQYSDIERNASKIFRLFESVNFTVNYSDFKDVHHVVMEISFYNGSIQYFNMNQTGVNESSYEYKPGYKTLVGPHNVSFLIYNDTNTLLNDHTTYTNFTVLSNCAIFNLESEYYLNDTLSAGLTVINFSRSPKDYQFEDWDITIVDSDDEVTQNNLLNLESSVNHVSFLIDNETFREVNKIYYIKINMTEKNSGIVRADYFPFTINNSDPIITSQVELSPDEVFRTEECIVSVNVTDVETSIDELTITVNVQDSEGVEVVQKILGFRGSNNFSIGFSIPSDRPIGTYEVTLTAKDKDNGVDTKITYLDVKNNYPKIHSYKINGLSMNQSVSVFYGRDLVFTFNVSDTEGVSYVRVALLNENEEWFNITREYKGEDTEITIRTQDLIGGMWYVYIYVIDTDGAVTSLIDDYDMAPQGIRIVPDVIGNYIPWIVFIFGLSIGVLVGIGIIYKYFKSKFIGTQPVSAEKKTIQPKKTITKKKVKPKSIEDELKKKEIVEEKPEKVEEKEGIPKRKIKRQL